MTTARKKKKAVKKEPPVKRSTTTKPGAASSLFDETEAKIMSTLMEFRKAGIESVPIMTVVAFCGYSHARTKSFQQAMQKLKKGGYVQNSKGFVSITMVGVKEAPSQDSWSVSNAQVHNRLKKLLSPKAAELFTLLCNGAPQSSEYLLKQLGYGHPRSKGYTESVKALKDLGLLNQFKDAKSPKTKLLQLSDRAFPCGRDEA
mmetsp:Transcript_7375/g.20474  ORF Transcript_7375/g.20474 Transcript_7375/m.20474 type:complete len:202 (-) Transcript_7375:65-670(-)